MSHIYQQKKQDALIELYDIIEDLFFAASLLRGAGDGAAANRIADIALNVAKERALLGKVLS